jgi:FeS assembly SUF system protein
VAEQEVESPVEVESEPAREAPQGQATAEPQPSFPTQPGSVPAAAEAAARPVASLPAEEIEASVVEVLKTVFDPEIPVNIYELGLIYDLDVSPAGAVGIKMTLTSPACPVAGSLPPEVQAKVEKVPGVTSAEVELVWDPVWNPGMMSEAARLQLGFF